MPTVTAHSLLTRAQVHPHAAATTFPSVAGLELWLHLQPRPLLLCCLARGSSCSCRGLRRGGVLFAGCCRKVASLACCHKQTDFLFLSEVLAASWPSLVKPDSRVCSRLQATAEQLSDRAKKQLRAAPAAIACYSQANQAQLKPPRRPHFSCFAIGIVRSTQAPNAFLKLEKAFG